MVDVKYNARVGVCPIISVSQSSFRLSDMSVVLSTMSWGHVMSETPSQNVAVGSYKVRHFGVTAPARLRSLRMKKVTEKKYSHTAEGPHARTYRVRTCPKFAPQATFFR